MIISMCVFDIVMQIIFQIYFLIENNFFKKFFVHEKFNLIHLQTKTNLKSTLKNKLELKKKGTLNNKNF